MAEATSSVSDVPMGFILGCLAAGLSLVVTTGLVLWLLYRRRGELFHRRIVSVGPEVGEGGSAGGIFSLPKALTGNGGKGDRID